MPPNVAPRCFAPREELRHETGATSTPCSAFSRSRASTRRVLRQGPVGLDPGRGEFPSTRRACRNYAVERGRLHARYAGRKRAPRRPSGAVASQQSAGARQGSAKVLRSQGHPELSLEYLYTFVPSPCSRPLPTPSPLPLPQRARPLSPLPFLSLSVTFTVPVPRYGGCVTRTPAPLFSIPRNFFFSHFLYLLLSPPYSLLPLLFLFLRDPPYPALSSLPQLFFPFHAF